MMSETELAGLRNLGPVSARWLVGAGITSVAELKRVGAVAALEGKHWTEVMVAEKAKLRKAAGLAGSR